MLHPEFYEFMDMFSTVTNMCQLLTNGTIPIKRVQRVKYILTWHSNQANQRQRDVFFNNSLLLKSKGADFEILLTFENSSDEQFFTELKNAGLEENIRELYIDAKFHPSHAPNVNSEKYIVNDRMIDSSMFLKLKMHRFKGWRCHLIDVNLLQNGDAYVVCLDNGPKHFTEIDLNAEYFVKCPLNECNRECRFEPLKYKE